MRFLFGRNPVAMTSERFSFSPSSSEIKRVHEAERSGARRASGGQVGGEPAPELLVLVHALHKQALAIEMRKNFRVQLNNYNHSVLVQLDLRLASYLGHFRKAST